MNDDKNILGRVLALALMLGAAYGVHAIVRGGGGACSFEGGSRCVMDVPDEARVQEKAAPAEAPDEDRPAVDDEAKLEAKAPVVPPATPQ